NRRSAELLGGHSRDGLRTRPEECPASLHQVPNADDVAPSHRYELEGALRLDPRRPPISRGRVRDGVRRGRILDAIRRHSAPLPPSLGFRGCRSGVGSTPVFTARRTRLESAWRMGERGVEVLAVRTRPLGKTGIDVSELALGTWGLSGDAYGPVVEQEVVRTI